ncbi:hypothetical protein ABH935_009318 [Catenulispora sp. GAS73]|uniref:hypothetical protein n=1 Tax=Catenulispora sp. GAS73 TaxID=3156269 RepID=UPI0035141AE8
MQHLAEHIAVDLPASRRDRRRSATPQGDRIATGLGRDRKRIGTQFLAESILLAVPRGTVGITSDALATARTSIAQHEPFTLLEAALRAGFGAALAIGGLYPSLAAAPTAPADALRSI